MESAVGAAIASNDLPRGTDLPGRAVLSLPVISAVILISVQQVAVEPTMGSLKEADNLALFVDALRLVEDRIRRIEIRELSLS